MSFKKDVTITIVSTVGFAAVGAMLGAALGYFIPQYYCSLFCIAPDVKVSTVRIGIQLGFIQGLQFGVVFGIILVLAMAWYRSRLEGWSDHVPQHVKKNAKIAIALLVVVMLIVAVPVGFFAFYIAASGGSDSGSPRLATVWSDTLRKYETPAEAEARIPNLVVFHFEDGQWVFGLGQNSHGVWNRGGGTIVVKDSRGNVRAFLGAHVCGSGDLPRGAKNLEEFYEKFSERGFAEYVFPEGQDP